jgi:hypothetical protein
MMRVTSGLRGAWTMTTTRPASPPKPFRSIIKTDIGEGDTAPGENLRCVGKIQAMLDEIEADLGFVPFVAHSAV